MEETRISNEAQIKKDVETSPKGKTEEEKRVIHVLEESQGEISSTKTNGERKDEESWKIDGSKRTRKPNLKTNVTVPRPFNLATEKRMTRERRGPMDFKEPKPVLAKSASFSHKPSNIKGTVSLSIKTSLKPKIQTNKKDDNNKEGNTMFKAVPLPNFYRQKDPSPKSEAKKTVDGSSKPLVIGDLVNTLPKSTKGSTRRISRGSSGSAKEPIVIKTTKNSLQTKEPIVFNIEPHENNWTYI